MADDNDNFDNLDNDPGSNLDALNALHLDGKGTERLDDADEQPDAPDGSAATGEDVKGFANILTSEQYGSNVMDQGTPPQQAAIPTSEGPPAEQYAPTEEDNTVGAEFDSVKPDDAPEQTVEESEDTQDGGEGAEPLTEQPGNLRATRIPDGGTSTEETGAADPAPVAAAAAAPVPEEEIPDDDDEPEDDEPIVTNAQVPTLVTPAASGTEGEMTKLDISASVNDIDGGGDVLTSLVISGIPDGFVIVDSNGNEIGTLSGGTWTLTNPTDADMDDIYLLDTTDGDGDYADDFTLSVSVTATEPGGSETATSSLAVSIEAVADDIAVSKTDTTVQESAAGAATVALNISVEDNDIDGSEAQSVYISGIPADTGSLFIDNDGDGVYSDGDVLVEAITETVTVDGTEITATADDPIYLVAADDLDKLTLSIIEDNSEDLNLTVYGVSEEDSNGDVAISDPQTLHVDVTVGAPVIDAETVIGSEDSYTSLGNVSVNEFADDDTEEMVVYLENVPDSVTLYSYDETTDTYEPLIATTYTDTDGVEHTGYVIDEDLIADDGSLTGVYVKNNAEDSDADFTLDIRAITTDEDGDTAQSTATINVQIEAVADDIAVSKTDTTVQESAAGAATVALDISVEDNDIDGSEAQSVYISGIPADTGSLFIDNDGDGVYSDGDVLVEAITETVTVDGVTITATEDDPIYLVAADDLDNLTLSIFEDNSEDLNLTVYGVSEESSNGDVAISLPKTLHVDVTVVAPEIETETVVGSEDTYTSLSDVSVNQYTDDDTETMVVYLENVPDSVTLYSYNETTEEYEPLIATTYTDTDGVEHTGYLIDDSLIADDGSLTGIYVKNDAEDSDADFTLDIRAITTDVDGDTAQSTATINVQIDAVADEPGLETADTGGIENQAIALDITVTDNDIDGSETQTIYISDIPEGATIQVNGVDVGADSILTEDLELEDGTIIDAGSVVLSEADLANLTVTPATDDSTDFELTVTVASVEADGGDTAVSTDRIFVDVGLGEATITVEDITGAEDTYISLSGITVAAYADDDSDTVTVYIEDVPDGVTLSAYDPSSSEADENGYVPLEISSYTDADDEDVTGYEIDSSLINSDGELVGVYIKNDAANSDADILDMTVRTIVTDVDTGTTSDTAYGENYADTVQTTQSFSVTVTAEADDANVSIAGMGVEDQWFDLDISASLQDTDESESITEITLTVPADVLLQDGSSGVAYSYTVNDDGTWTYDLTTAELDDIQAKAPADSDEDISITLEVTTTEAGTDGQVSLATKTTTLNQTISILSDADTPTLSVTDETQSIDENRWFNLDTIVDGETAVSGSLTDLDGSESLTYTITAQQDSRIWIDADNDGSWNRLEVITLEAGESITVTAEQIADGQVYVGAAAYWSSADSDDTIKFDIQAVATESNDATDDALESGLSDDLSRSGTAVSDVETLTLTVNPVANRVSITVSASGDEDQVGGIALSPTLTLLDRYDDSEDLVGDVEILVAREVVDGSEQSTMDGTLEYNGETLVSTGTTVIDGVTYDIYTVDVDTLTETTDGIYQVSDLIYVPAENSDEDFSYRIRVTTQEEANGDTYVTTSSEQTLSVDAVADAPNITVGAYTVGDENASVTGTEDTYIDLDLTASLVDTDGSETLTGAELQNVPEGWSVAYVDEDGKITDYATQSEDGTTWVLDPDNVDSVVLIPPTDSDADATGLVFQVTTTEADNGDTATSSITFDVVVEADADEPTILVRSTGLLEDTTVQLHITAALTDLDGSETLTVTIGDMPDGATLVNSEGVEYDLDTYYDADTGLWTFSADELDDIWFKPAENSNEDATLQITAVSTETENGDTATQTAELSVNVIGVADAPQVTEENTSVTGTEDTLIDPNLEAFASVDTDGSETLSIVITGLPDGVEIVLVDPETGETLDADQYVKAIDDGVWVVDADYIDAVRFSTPEDYSGTFEVTMRLVSTENDGDEAVENVTLTVTVDPDADEATGSIGTTVDEDSWNTTGTDEGIPFSLTTSVTDAGGVLAELADNGTEAIADIDVTVNVSGLVGSEGSYDGIYVTYEENTYFPDANGLITITDVTFDAGQTSVTESGFTLFGVDEDSSTDVPVFMVVTTQDGASTQTTTINGEITIKPIADEPSLNIDAPADGGTVYDLSGSSSDDTVAGGESTSSGVSITFEGESAGYKNALGYYKIDEDGNIYDVEMIWTNASETGSGGSLKAGTSTVELDVDDGETFGIFLIADGYNDLKSLNNGYFEFRDSSVSGDGTANISDSAADLELWFVHANGTETNVSDLLSNYQGIYHTAAYGDNVDLNTPGVGDDSIVHTAAVSDNGDGSYTIGFEDLLTSSSNYDGDFNDSVFTLDLGDSNVGFANAHYDEITEPEVTLPETQTLTLTGDFGVTDLDGSETAYMVIDGLPAGVIVVGGINNGDGSWTLSAGTDPESIVIQSTNGSAGILDVTLTTYVTDDDPDSWRTDTEVASTTIQIDFGDDGSGGGDGYGMTYPHAEVSGDLSGTEDGSISLDGLTITATDADGNATTIDEDGLASDGSTISLVIELPEGWTISGTVYELETDAETGVTSYTVPYSEIGSVTITPPDDYAGDDYDIGILAVATDSKGWYDTTVTTTDVDVSVTAETDGASLSASVSGDLLEDTDVDVSLTISATDVDYSEVLATGEVTITLSDVDGEQPGTLSYADASSLTYDPATNTYTLQLTDEQIAEFADSEDGTINVTGLTFTPAENFSGDVTINYSVDVAEDNGDGTVSDVETSSGSTSFTVEAVTDVAEITAQDITGSEDSYIALDVTIKQDDLQARTYTETTTTVDPDTGAETEVKTTYDIGPDDETWGSEVMSVVINDVPSGVVIIGASNNGDGTWTVDDENVVYDGDGTYSLQGVYVLPSSDDSEDFTLSVSTIVRETGSWDLTTVDSGTFNVTVQAETDGVYLNPQDAEGVEDQLIAIDLDMYAYDSSETHTITISGVPEGASITNADGVEIGTNNGDGTWTLTQDVIDAYDLDYGNSIYFSAPANVADTWEMTATVTTEDEDAETDAVQYGDAAEVSSTFSFTVTTTAEADAPTLTAAASSGDEDSSIVIDLSALLVEDVDGSETLSVTITGAPEGTTFTTASGDVISASVDEDGNLYWVIPANEDGLSIDGLTMQAPDDYNGTVELTAVATSTEVASTASTDAVTFSVTIDAVNDDPTVTISGADISASGTQSEPLYILNEDQTITIADIDSTAISEMTVTINGAQDGDTIAFSGVTPTLNSDGDLVVSVDGTEFTVSYDADTDTLTFSGEGTMDQYETLIESVILTNESGTLSDGLRTITISVTDAEGGSGSDDVAITINGDVTLSGDALGDTAFDASGELVLPGSSVSATEDEGVTIDLSGLQQTSSVDGSETLSVVITGAPEGTTFETADGTIVEASTAADGSLYWEITTDVDGDVADDITMHTPEDYDQDIDLEIEAVNADGSALDTPVTMSYSVEMTAVNDAPDVSVTGAGQSYSGTVTEPLTVLNDTQDLVITDVDSSQISEMTIVIGGETSDGDTLGLSGLTPTLNTDGDLVVTVDGTEFTVSYDETTGTLTFSGDGTMDQYETLIESVTLTNDSGTLAEGERTFEVSVSDAEGATGSAETSVEISAGVTLADSAQSDVYFDSDGEMVLQDREVSGTEDEGVVIDLSGLQAGVDGSETLSVVITGAPEGTTFETADGTIVEASTAADGSLYWEITTDVDGDVADDITMHTPEEYDQDFELEVEATNADGSALENPVTVSYSVNMSGVNDAPTIALSSASLAVAAGLSTAAITLAGAAETVEITDVDSSGVSQMTVTLSGGADGDTLGLSGLTPDVSDTGVLIVTLDGTVFTVTYADGALTFTGDGTMDQYETLLEAITFTNASGELVAGERSIEIAVTDAEGATGTEYLTVAVEGEVDLVGSAMGDVYFADDGTMVDADNTIEALTGFDISGSDTDVMQGMTVELSGDGLGMDDSLALSGLDLTMSDGGQFTIDGLSEGVTISVSYDTENNTLYFSGDGTVADYNTIADSLVLSSSDGVLESGTRTVTVTTYDENGDPSDSVASDITLTSDITLVGDELGDVRWGTNGDATIGDTIMVQYGSSIDYVDGGTGMDTLSIQDNGADGGWLFTQAEDGTITATSTSDEDKSFVVNLDADVDASLTSDSDGVVFNGDASGSIEFNDGSTMQFDNIDRLLG